MHFGAHLLRGLRGGIKRGHGRTRPGRCGYDVCGPGGRGRPLRRRGPARRLSIGPCWLELQAAPRGIHRPYLNPSPRTQALLEHDPLARFGPCSSGGTNCGIIAAGIPLVLRVARQAYLPQGHVADGRVRLVLVQM